MNRIARALLNYFIKGMLIVIPLGGALFLIVWIIAKIDYSLNLSDMLWVHPQTNKPLYIPGLGIVTVLLIILLAGVVVTNIVTDPIKAWFNRWLNRLPLIKFIYTSFKDFTEAFVGDEKKFTEPVLVTINETGMKKIGFLTQKDLSSLGLEGEVAVYFPFSYSFAGQLCIVKTVNVKPLKMNGSDAMKFVVSGGVSHLD